MHATILILSLNPNLLNNYSPSYDPEDLSLKVLLVLLLMEEGLQMKMLLELLMMKKPKTKGQEEGKEKEGTDLSNLIFSEKWMKTPAVAVVMTMTSINLSFLALG